MAGVHKVKNTFTQPINMNDTSTDRELNYFDSPEKDAFDGLSSPVFGWSSSESHCEWTGLEDSHNGTSVSGSQFLGHRPSTHRDVYEDLSWAGTEFDFPFSMDHTSHNVQNLLEEDLVFRLAARTGRQYSSVRRGLETNLAELQVAGDVLPSHSTLLEEGWSCISTPALSVTSDISDEASLRIPSTPQDEHEHSVVPATVVVADDLSSLPPAEAPALRQSGLSEESKTFDLQIASDECQVGRTGKKRKRDTAELDDSCESLPKSPSCAAETKLFKWFSIEGRESRRSLESKIMVYTQYGKSCCSRVGDAGYCQFGWRRNGKVEKCGVELIQDSGIVAAHFALHFEELGHYRMAKSNRKWKPRCPWCNKQPTTFADFTRHVIYSELELNLTRCGCGGTINRGNQGRFTNRHEETKKHRNWVMQSRASVVASDEDEPTGQQVEFIGGGNRGTKRRRLDDEVIRALKKEDADEKHDEFVEGSSTDVLGRRPSSGKKEPPVKEEPDEEREEFIQGSSTGATRKRRKPKKTKATANEDLEEEQEETVEGSSTGAKRRRLR